MKAERFATKLAVSVLGVFALASMSPSRALAQGGHPHMPAAQREEVKPAERINTNALIATVRRATERFKDVRVAEAEGYHPQFGCVSGPDAGAMGLHYVNSSLVGDGVLDATRPEIVIYEPTPNGGVRLIGADFLVLADAWNATHPHAPELMGQFFHLFEAPNRYGLPAFYTLHVWAWKNSPAGAFVNWHPNVSCDAFSGQN